MSDWQPIETAPDEGQFLIWNGEQISIASKGEWEGWSFFTHEVKAEGNFNATSTVTIRPPTHWRPLPEPPHA